MHTPQYVWRIKLKSLVWILVNYHPLAQELKTTIDIRRHPLEYGTHFIDSPGEEILSALINLALDYFRLYFDHYHHGQCYFICFVKLLVLSTTVICYSNFIWYSIIVICLIYMSSSNVDILRSMPERFHQARYKHMTDKKMLIRYFSIKYPQQKG